MQITVPKIGTGTENDPFRADTELTYYVIEERETEFVIEVLSY
ncbi:MAG: hypothetical protein AB1815_02600 [Bacillota bacterium]